MVYTTWKIEHYERTDDNVWSSTATEVTEAYDVVVRTRLGEGKDTFEFKITNFNSESDNFYEVGDKVVLFYKINVASSSLVSSDVVMNGIVTDVPQEESAKNNYVRVTGNNYSESLMNALVFFSPTANTKLHTYLQEAINSIGIYNENFRVGWDSNNPTTKIGGADFPVVTERWYYKNMLKLLEKYSQDLYTEDGNYYWYVNVDNELVWQPKEQGVDYEFSTSVDEYKSLKIKKDLKGVVNFVIAKGGYSPNGKPITTRVDDPISRSKHGFKYHLMYDEKTYAEQLFQEDGLREEGADSNYPASYPHTPSWGGDPIASSTAYDAAFRVEVKSRLRTSARAFINERKNGKLMIELEFQPGKSWSIGNNVKVTIPQVGKTNNVMRVQDAEYTTTTERYTLIEDEGTVGDD